MMYDNMTLKELIKEARWRVTAQEELFIGPGLVKQVFRLWRRDRQLLEAIVENYHELDR